MQHSEAQCPEGAAGSAGGTAAEDHSEPTPPVWLQSYGLSEITDVASDSADNVLVARTDVGIAKLDSRGATQWSKPFGERVATDAQNDVFVAGSFAGSLTLGSQTLRARGDRDVFVVKLDQNGTESYAVSLGGTEDDAVDSLSVDSGGEVAVSGPGLGTVKLDAAGHVAWQKSFFGRTAFDSQGSLVLTGALRGSQDFGAGPRESRGGADVFVVKLAPNGELLFSQVFGDGAELQQGEAIATDRDDNIVVAGTFDGKLDLESGSLEVPPNPCSEDAWCVTFGFVVRLDPQGKAAWSVSLGPMRNVADVVSRGPGDIILSGALPGGVRPFRRTLLAAFDAEGRPLWQRSEWPFTGIGAGHDLSVDTQGDLIWSLSARPALDAEEQFYLAKLAP